MIVELVNKVEMEEMVKHKVYHGLKEIYTQLREMRERLADMETMIKKKSLVK